MVVALQFAACGGGDDGDETSASTSVVMPLGDLEQGAQFAVFSSEEEAKTNEQDASALIGVSPTELTGNVVRGFDAAADETPDDQSVVEGCLS